MSCYYFYTHTFILPETAIAFCITKVRWKQTAVIQNTANLLDRMIFSLLNRINVQLSNPVFHFFILCFKSYLLSRKYLISFPPIVHILLKFFYVIGIQTALISSSLLHMSLTELKMSFLLYI